VLNAANEEAVAAFLAGGLPFPRVAATNAAVLEAHLAQRRGHPLRDLRDVAAADAWGRARARELLGAGREVPA
jgi:1-deoxy-D-xylulose-5-phosphate reductoisomerase